MINNKPSYYIGINSGTSLDGIDVAIFEFKKNKTNTLHTYQLNFPEGVAAQLKNVSISNSSIRINQIGKLQAILGHLYAKGVNDLLKSAGFASNEIIAIGCHGQTVYHAPNASPCYTLQLNNGAIIAQSTNIDTIVDFRSADMAIGGQGAPLAPAFHKAFFYDKQAVGVINLGGIANVSIIDKTGLAIGYDIGPANCLLDMWMNEAKGLSVDINGQFAAKGLVIPEILEKLKSDHYFKLSYPKSTGVDYFNLQWLLGHISDLNRFNSEDIQATLCELTAISIANELLKFHKDIPNVYLCGGGANNAYLVQRIKQNLVNNNVYLSGEIGIDHEWVECAGFAWLAKQYIECKPVDLTNITGASQPAILGACYPSR